MQAEDSIFAGGNPQHSIISAHEQYPEIFLSQADMTKCETCGRFVGKDQIVYRGCLICQS